MLFKDIIGNVQLKKKLLMQCHSGKISHASLFIGKDGYGPLPFALAVAQYLNCRDRQPEDACGKCASCLKFEKLVHPDLHFIFPVATTDKVTSKPVSQQFLTEWREAFVPNPYLTFSQWFEALGVDKKQGNIAAEESNEIIKKASLKPYEAEFKVFIIWQADKMNSSASNKLLKVLEEPPPKTLFFLISEHTENLLATILSRVQITKVGRIPEEEMTAHIMQAYQMDEAKAHKISLLSEGSWTEARKHIGVDSHEDFYFQAFSEWARLCFKVDVPGIIVWVDQMAVLGREKQKYFFTYTLNLYRESLLQNYQMEQLGRLTGEEAQFKKKFAPFVHHKNVVQMVEEVNRASYHIERNANAKTVFLDLSLKVIKLLKIKSVTLPS